VGSLNSAAAAVTTKSTNGWDTAANTSTVATFARSPWHTSTRSPLPGTVTPLSTTPEGGSTAGVDASPPTQCRVFGSADSVPGHSIDLRMILGKRQLYPTHTGVDHGPLDRSGWHCAGTAGR
jgi:hypothetical protein